MLGNYDLLLESSQELQEFLVFIYENEAVIADIDIPFEWKSLIDESYDEDGNQYYSLTNRAIELLIAEGFMSNVSQKFGHAVGRVGNAVQGAAVRGQMGLQSARAGAHKLGHTIDNKIDNTVGKKAPKLANGLKQARRTGVSMAGHIGAEALTHNPQVAHLVHGAVSGH